MDLKHFSNEAPQQENKVLKAALDYIKRGYAVLPLKPDSKAPACKHGVYDASCDEKQIKAWFEHRPHYNIGIAMGEKSGIVAFDIDVKNYQPGTNPWEDFLDEYGGRQALKACQLTPSGGFHYLAHYPHEKPIKTIRKLNDDRALEVLSDGNYIVAYPSQINGIEYTWEPESNPLEDSSPMSIPSAWFDAFEKKSIKSNTRRKEIPLKMFEPENSADYEYHEILSMTQAYVRRAIGGCVEGARHNELIRLIPKIAERLKTSDAYDLVLEFASLTGLPENEALDELAWGQKHSFNPDLPKKKIKKLNTRRCKPVKEYDSLEAAREETYQHLKNILFNPDGRFHVLSPTVGVGKTFNAAEAVSDLMDSNGPRKADGSRYRVLFLTDSHNLAREFIDMVDYEPVYVSFPGMEEIKINNLQRLEGRNKNNCAKHDIIKGSDNPGAFCWKYCDLKGKCSYFMGRKAALREALVVAPKQSFLNDKATLDSFDVIIADEDITDHLYEKKSFDRDSLHKIKQAVILAELPKKQEKKALKFIDSILNEMDNLQDGKERLKRKPPVVDYEKIESFFKLNRGGFLPAMRFFSLFSGKYTIRITPGANPLLHITSRKERLIEKLKNKTVINLDATPIRLLLKEFKPLYFERNVNQNLQYWQEAQYSFSRDMLSQEKYNGLANDRIRQIIDRLEGETNAVFTFKNDAVNMKALLPSGTKIGVYGANSKGTNDFEDCDNLILKGSFTPNINAIKDLASVGGVKWQALLRDKRDAELAQTIGRIRGVNKEKLGKVFILTNGGKHYSVKLDKKPKPLREFFKSRGERISPPQPLHNIETQSVQNFSQPTFDRSKTRLFGGKKQHQITMIQKHIKACLEKYGFFAYDLVLTERGYFVAPPPSPLPDEIKPRKFKKYAPEALAAMGLEEDRVLVAPNVWVKVWGDKSKALAFITNPEEEAQAIETVKEVYPQLSYGTVEFQTMLNKLGLSLDFYDLWRNRDFKTERWALLTYRYFLIKQFVQIE